MKQLICFAEDFKSESNNIQFILDEYKKFKQTHNYMDYDDLLFLQMKFLNNIQMLQKKLQNNISIL